MNGRGNPVLAAVYDLVMRPAELFGLRRQRRRVAGAATGRVLEIGAGTGTMLGHYADPVSQVVATDPDPHMLARARPKAQRAAVPVELVEAGAEDLPFDDGSFDTVVVALALCTVADLEAVLREVQRVLVPEGRLVFLEHVRSGRPLVARAQEFLTPAWERVAGGCHLDRDTVAAIESAGFELERVWRSGDRRGSLVQGSARAGR